MCPKTQLGWELLPGAGGGDAARGGALSVVTLLIRGIEAVAVGDEGLYRCEAI